jgi:hypothetical protein
MMLAAGGIMAIASSCAVHDNGLLAAPWDHRIIGRIGGPGKGCMVQLGRQAKEQRKQADGLVLSYDWPGGAR